MCLILEGVVGVGATFLFEEEYMTPVAGLWVVKSFLRLYLVDCGDK